MDVNLGALYTSLHRVAFSLSVAWVAVACLTGHGGKISFEYYYGSQLQPVLLHHIKAAVLLLRDGIKVVALSHDRRMKNLLEIRFLIDLIKQLVIVS